MAFLIGMIILSSIAAGYPGEDDRFPRHVRGSEIYDNNGEEAQKFRGWDPEDVVGRLKRFDSKHSDLEDVKGALKEILSGRNIEELFTIQAEDTTHTHATSRSHARFGKMIDPETNDETNALDEQELSTITATRSKHNILQPTGKIQEEALKIEEELLKIQEETLKFEDETDQQSKQAFYRKQEEITTELEEAALILREGTSMSTTTSSSTTTTSTTSLKTSPETTTTTSSTATTTSSTTTATTSTDTTDPTATTSPETTPDSTTTRTLPWCQTTKSTTSSTSTTTVTTTTLPPKLDIPALMAIISNFTYDWLANLTRSVNETLLKKGFPTCAELTTPTPLTTYGENMTGTLMGKCFFCGLEEVGLPRRAYCADAFAGDFLPLMPVEAKARGMLSKYRKYCRYKNKHPYYMERGDTRSVWGAWTGGCAVRWIDLSGIYTQRTCRIRSKPVLGKHYGSKRMAKLELALQNVDNGCIISPMASLVPLSRGISLYARFHACVCTGNWCNRATVSQPWTIYTAISSMCVIAKDFITIC